MRPHDQSERARLRDVQALLRALGRAAAAPRQDAKLVKVLKEAVHLMTSSGAKEVVRKKHSPARARKLHEESLSS